MARQVFECQPEPGLMSCLKRYLVECIVSSSIMCFVVRLRESRHERHGRVDVRVLRLLNPPRSVGPPSGTVFTSMLYSFKLVNQTNLSHREIPGTLPSSSRAFSQAFTVNW